MSTRLNSFDVIKTLHMSEKALDNKDLINSQRRTAGMREDRPPLPRYTFRVDRRANKLQIRKAVEELFPGVKVKSVNTMNMHGKPKRQQTRTPGYTSNWKKAIVTLKEGTIDEMI
tara:strand:+ start:156 stop:500 length:345 start_codon:yes stop_codon:yes gene_type:complete